MFGALFACKQLNVQQISNTSLIMRIEKFLAASPLFALWATHTEVIGDFQKRLAGEGVHFIQALILTGLFFEERPVRPTELAKTLRTEKSTLSHALRSLEKAGWVERSLSDEDARAYFFSLTREGKKKVPRLIKLFDQVQDHIEADSRSQRFLSSFELLEEVYKAAVSARKLKT